MVDGESFPERFRDGTTGVLRLFFRYGIPGDAAPLYLAVVLALAGVAFTGRLRRSIRTSLHHRRRGSRLFT